MAQNAGNGPLASLCEAVAQAMDSGTTEASSNKLPKRVDKRKRKRCRVESRTSRVDNRKASRSRWTSPRKISASTRKAINARQAVVKEVAKEVAAQGAVVDNQDKDDTGEVERVESKKQAPWREFTWSMRTFILAKSFSEPWDTGSSHTDLDIRPLQLRE